MLAPAKSLKTALLVVGLIALILISLVIVWVANLLTKPIRTVTDGRRARRRG